MIDSRIISHFNKVDPKMAQLAKGLVLDELDLSDNYLEKLCREITGQQLSGAVVKIIFGRFKDLFPDQVIDPGILVSFSEDRLRSVGMSYAKARSLRDIAKRVLDGRLELGKFDQLDDELVKSELVAVKGIGPWTAEMFLIFSLGRPDVFSPLDLGLRKGIQKLYGLEQMPSPIEAVEIAKKWLPYRSYASRLLWRSLDADIYF